MKIQNKSWMHLGLAVLLGLIVSGPSFAASQRGGQRGAPANAPNANNGNAPNRGNGGAPDGNAGTRQQIQAARKAAIASAESQFQQAMLSAKFDAQSATDPNARAHAKMEEDQARLDRKRAVEKANATAKAALAALGNSK